MHLLPARGDDVMAMGSPVRYPSGRIGLVGMDGVITTVAGHPNNDYMPKKPFDIVYSKMTAEKRAI